MNNLSYERKRNVEAEELEEKHQQQLEALALAEKHKEGIEELEKSESKMRRNALQSIRYELCPGHLKWALKNYSLFITNFFFSPSPPSCCRSPDVGNISQILFTNFGSEALFDYGLIPLLSSFKFPQLEFQINTT